MKYVVIAALLLAPMPVFAEPVSRFDEFPVDYEATARALQAQQEQETAESEAEQPKETDFYAGTGYEEQETDNSAQITSMNF